MPVQHGLAQVSQIMHVMREFSRRGTQEKTDHNVNELVRGALAVTRGQWHQVAELTLALDEDLPSVRCVGATIKRREDTHRMAEANRAFAHYRY